MATKPTKKAKPSRTSKPAKKAAVKSNKITDPKVTAVKEAIAQQKVNEPVELIIHLPGGKLKIYGENKEVIEEVIKRLDASVPDEHKNPIKTVNAQPTRLDHSLAWMHGKVQNIQALLYGDLTNSLVKLGVNTPKPPEVLQAMEPTSHAVHLDTLNESISVLEGFIEGLRTELQATV